MDVDLEPVMRDALTKGDPKLILSVLLTLVVMAFRERWFAKVQMKGRLGDALRWLGTTHWGGVLSSMFGAGLGAVISALSTKTMPSAGALLNAVFIAAAASGVSTWMKWRKQSADKAVLDAKKEPEPLPPPPPVGPPPATGLLLMMAGALALASCSTLKDAAYGFKGTASYAVMETQRTVEEWNEKELDRIAHNAPLNEVDAALKKQDAKARAATKALKACAQAIRILNDALTATNAAEQKDWVRLMMAVVDAFNAVRTTLTTYDIKVPIPDLKLPGGL